MLHVIKESGLLRALSPLSSQNHSISHAAFEILQQSVGWLAQECALIGAVEKIPAAANRC